jgi:hypothetical protein
MHRRINSPMPSAVIMPASEVETYLANGWRLTDAPDCSGARMLPPKIPSLVKGARDGP